MVLTFAIPSSKPINAVVTAVPRARIGVVTPSVSFWPTPESASPALLILSDAASSFSCAVFQAELYFLSSVSFSCSCLFSSFRRVFEMFTVFCQFVVRESASPYLSAHFSSMSDCSLTSFFCVSICLFRILLFSVSASSDFALLSNELSTRPISDFSSRSSELMSRIDFRNVCSPVMPIRGPISYAIIPSLSQLSLHLRAVYFPHALISCNK